MRLRGHVLFTEFSQGHFQPLAKLLQNFDRGDPALIFKLAKGRLRTDTSAQLGLGEAHSFALLDKFADIHHYSTPLTMQSQCNLGKPAHPVNPPGWFPDQVDFTVVDTINRSGSLGNRFVQEITQRTAHGG